MFNNDNLHIEILDVFKIYRKRTSHFTPKRSFHILTKRIGGYTDMFFDKKTFTITSDMLLYIPSNTEYSRKSYDDEEIIAIHFNILNKNFSEPHVLQVDSDECNKVFESIYNTWTEKKTGYKYKCIAILYDYLSTLIIEKGKSTNYYQLEKSINYIEENLTKKINIGTLAKLCNMCETQYRKLFKIEFGVSPVKYINKLRINNAIEKLANGYYSIMEISEQCGFSDQKYFNKIFKEETGITPSQYKKDIYQS